MKGGEDEKKIAPPVVLVFVNKVEVKADFEVEAVVLV